MAEKAKKTTSKKPTSKPKTSKTIKATKAVKTNETAIKSSVSGKRAACDKPAMGKIVCLIVAVIAIVVVIVTMMLRGQTLGSNYFVSDNTKYVLNIAAEEGSEDGLLWNRLVYFYEGDKITGAKIYYEFKDNDSAKKAYESLTNGATDEEKSRVELNGKYVIVTTVASEYENMTATQVKEQFEAYEKLQETLKNSQNKENSEKTEEKSE